MNKKIIGAIIIILGAVILFALLANMPAREVMEENLPVENNEPVITDVVEDDNIPATTTTTTVTTTPSSPTTVTARLGQKVTLNGVTGTVTEVLEDSRCPSDVQCIQAGTVRIKVNMTYGALSQNATLTLNQPLTMSGRSITLTDVKPYPVSGTPIASSDYVFTLLVK